LSLLFLYLFANFNSHSSIGKNWELAKSRSSLRHKVIAHNAQGQLTTQYASNKIDARRRDDDPGVAEPDYIAATITIHVRQNAGVVVL
jgi:hypothetical protein